MRRERRTPTFPLKEKRQHGTTALTVTTRSTASNELQVAVTYTLWIPEDVKILRGIIVHQHGAGTTASIEGSTAAYDLHTLTPSSP